MHTYWWVLEGTGVFNNMERETRDGVLKTSNRFSAERNRLRLSMI